MYSRIIFLIVKVLQVVIQRLGRGGGTALPGLVAEKLHGGLLQVLSGQLSGTIVVAGTNGKTTTSRLLASYLEGDQRRLVHNRSGSNLARGMISALVAQSDWKGRVQADWGLFEVDEAVLPKILPTVKPTYVIALNLFRDQLDRYGEVDSVALKWQKACRELTDATTLVLNADDPLVAFLGRDIQARIIYYGVAYDSAETQVAAYGDSRYCPVCGKRLKFSRVSYSHLGTYVCPAGDFKRPEPEVVVSDIVLKGMDGSRFTVRGHDQSVSLDLGLAGLYNIYNVAAAVTVAWLLGLKADMLLSKTRNFQAVFGRLERVKVGSTTLTLILVKNPTGYNQVLQTLTTDAKANCFWLLLNDRFADGRDVSWIWDVELERLAGQARKTLVSGTRAYDLALRAKYAGFAEDQIQTIASLSDGLRIISRLKQPKVYCLCTYTAMLELRRLLQKQRSVESYHRG